MKTRTGQEKNGDVGFMFFLDASLQYVHLFPAMTAILEGNLTTKVQLYFTELETSTVYVVYSHFQWNFMYLFLKHSLIVLK